MALAIAMNKGKPEDVEKTLGYAADMALETRNPNDLVSVADLLFLHKTYERVGRCSTWPPRRSPTAPSR